MPTRGPCRARAAVPAHGRGHRSRHGTVRRAVPTRPISSRVVPCRVGVSAVVSGSARLGPAHLTTTSVPGAYSEKVAGKAYPGCDAIPYDQFEVAFSAVELWITNRAVLPVDNSLGSSIHRNYDLLLRHRLHIVSEVQLPVHHCLMALPGVLKECLTLIVSHPQALAQCEHTLTAMGLNVVRKALDDTAGAAEYVAANGLRNTADIASSSAPELYDMEVLADGIQDDYGNVTRFVMLATESIVPRTDRPHGEHDQAVGARDALHRRTSRDEDALSEPRSPTPIRPPSPPPFRPPVVNPVAVLAASRRPRRQIRPKRRDLAVTVATVAVALGDSPGHPSSKSARSPAAAVLQSRGFADGRSGGGEAEEEGEGEGAAGPSPPEPSLGEGDARASLQFELFDASLLDNE